MVRIRISSRRAGVSRLLISPSISQEAEVRSQDACRTGSASASQTGAGRTSPEINRAAACLSSQIAGRTFSAFFRATIHILPLLNMPIHWTAQFVRACRLKAGA
jgi:hypothetical protein